MIWLNYLIKEAFYMRKIGKLRLFLFCFIAILVLGCVKRYQTSEIGAPLDESAIEQIVIGKTTSLTTFLIYVADTQIKISCDELLLFFNKETDIVDDVAYRKETTRP